MTKIGSKNNNNTSVPTLAEYITTQITSKRAAALDKSRNRTSIRVPMIPNTESKERWNKKFDDISYWEEKLSKSMAEGNIRDAEYFKERLDLLLDQKEKGYPELIPGANCIYNAGDCYGLNVASNQIFSANHKNLGFKKVPFEKMESGDIVQDARTGVPTHAMIYDSKNSEGNLLFNYARGIVDPIQAYDINKNYVKQGKYPLPEKDYDVYKYVGTPADSTQWINEYKQLYGNTMRCGGRRKAQLGLDIREGGIAIPIANNMFYIEGRKHAAGGVAIGPNNKNGVEVEGGEVVEMIDSNHPSVGRQFKAGGQQQTMRVFSSVPFLRGVSPAELVLGGANPDTVFKAQEEFKDRNRINDDGTTYEMGGEGNAKSKRSRPVTGVLPYGYTIRNLYAVENPYRKGIKGNVAKMYDSRTLGAGVDVVSGHPELYKKAKAGRITKKQADETAVIHLRKDDNAIRSNYADVYGKAAADTLSYGPRFLVAQARYQQGNVRKAWQPIHKAMAKGDAKALKKAVLQVTPKDHTYRRKWIEDFKVYKMGGMIYEINGNVRNGLSLRSKAKYGLATKYLKKKDNKSEVNNIEKEEVNKVSNVPALNPDVARKLGLITLGTLGTVGVGGVTAYGLNKFENYVKQITKPSLEISQKALDEYNEKYARKTQGKTTKGFTPKNPLKDSKNIQYQRLNINESNIGLYDSKDPIVRATIKARGLNPERVTANGSFKRGSSNLSASEQRKLDKDYNRVIGNKEPKSGFGAKPADKVIISKYPDTSISSKPVNVVGKTYDPTVEFRQAAKPKTKVSAGLNNYLKKLGKGVRGLGVIGSFFDIYNNLFPSEEAEILENLRVRMKKTNEDLINRRQTKYGGRIKAENGKFLKYKNGVFTDPDSGDEYDVDPEVFKMYGNSFEEGVIPFDDRQYRGKLRIITNPRNQKTGDSYIINPLTGEWIRNGITETPEPSVKGTTKVNSKPSSPARGRGTKVSTPKATSQSTPTIQDTVNKITADAWKASKTPKIDLSKVEMPAYNVNDLGSKETKAAKAKLNTSSTGGGAPWVPQYNTITGRDWLGVGTNLAGHIASYFANNALLKKAPMPIKPVQFQAAKLKTTHNINPDLDNINEVTQMNLAEVGRNTASSNTSIARKQRIMNEARDARNKLYGQKENIETQLINLDRRNRQDVYNRNIAAYNDWLDKTYVAKSNNLLNKQRNLINLISGIPSAVNNMLGTIETRKLTNDMIRAIAAPNPNADGRLLGIGDYYSQKLPDGRTAIYNKNHKLVKYV